MKSFARSRPFAALVLVFAMLSTPLVALAKKGEANYKRGLQYETALQWDKAAQEFALAVAALPSDIEYQLHYQRAIFNASQVFMQRGRALAEQGDYTGAYNAFRQAYGFDPVNLLAASEMERMLRLQRQKQGLPTEEDNGKTTSPRGTNESTTAYPRTGAANGKRGGAAATAALAPQDSERSQPLRNINFINVELEQVIRKLTEDLSLNVIFDRDFAQQVGKRQVTYNLRDVTTARALDFIFTAQGLFFQKLDRRTILVADQSKRPAYQQLVLRTFYLSNIEPEAARQLIQQTLPANAGRQPTVTLNKTTNSITVRDTPENIRLISELLPTVDKDRAEVVMEVAIYEVSRTDLLQLGNQIGTADTLSNLGGVQTSSLLIGGARRLAAGTAGATIPLATGVGLLIPASALSAFQKKDNTRLVFSTQVHAFDDEKSETRIGEKVPVQTASVFNGISTGTGTGQGGTGGAVGSVFGNGFPVIQYEDTGLSLDFTPKVFPNQDVQIKMVIDTKDAVVSGSGNSLTPTFTQRRVTGTARIPNNRTIMIASIAQDRNSDGREGLPLLGLIPILGRLFSTPTKRNSTRDVVITMTPRVLRAPSVNPSDEETRPTGSIQTPQTDSLEALVRDADREDQLAAARRLPTNVVVQLPPATDNTAPLQTATTTNVANSPATTAAAATPAMSGATTHAEPVTYVPAPNILVNAANSGVTPGNSGASTTAQPAAIPATPANTSTVVNTVPANLTTGAPQAKPVSLETSKEASSIAPTQVTTNAAPAEATTVNKAEAIKTETNAAAGAGVAPAISSAELRLVTGAGEMRVGGKQRVMLMLKTDAPLGLAAATLRFDPRVTKINVVSKGSMFEGQAGAPLITQSVDPRGVLVLSIAPAAGASPLTGEGTLLFIEIEGVAAGESALS
ncbi:MAG TPA: secretin N-terminal domain-containing protein, partial [Pyrinomonadaceae bacterium]|nr:secretin N-terminal domain-containing protein [Pyrinomonadaceae bacterium]